MARSKTPKPYPGNVARVQPRQWNLLFMDAGIRPTGRFAVGMVISGRANSKTGKAWPTRENIAKATGLSPDVISTHTNALVESGWLLKQQNEHGRNNIYWLCVPEQSAPKKHLGLVPSGVPVAEAKKSAGATAPAAGPAAAQEPVAAQEPPQQVDATAEAVDLEALTLDELMAYTLEAASGSAQYKAAVAERVRRLASPANAGAMPD